MGLSVTKVSNLILSGVASQRDRPAQSSRTSPASTLDVAHDPHAAEPIRHHRIASSIHTHTHDMPLLPSLFRGRPTPPSSFQSYSRTTSSSPSPSTPEGRPVRPSRNPPETVQYGASTEDDLPSRLKSKDYAISPSRRPLPPIPLDSPLKSGISSSATRQDQTTTPTRSRGRAASSPTPALVLSSTPRSRASTLYTPSQTPASCSPARYNSSRSVTPPSLKRRPTALKLQTSNLSPPSALASEGFSTSRQDDHKLPRVLFYIPEESATPTTPPSPTPAPSTAGTARDDTPFQNVALPWSTVPVATIRSSLGYEKLDSIIDYTLENLARGAPRLLPPSILMTAASEDARLRAELERLKVKYQSVTRQRDRTIGEIEKLAMAGEMRSVIRAVGSVRKLVRRCDRVAKQLYICNDQIRQIEIQGEEHIIGALRYASDRIRPTSETTAINIRGGITGLPILTVDISNTATPTSSILASPVWTPLPTDSKDQLKTSMEERTVHFEPLFENIRTPREREDSRPNSVATVLSLRMSSLGFPLPPTRMDGSFGETPGAESTFPTNLTAYSVGSHLRSTAMVREAKVRSITKAASTTDLQVFVSPDSPDDNQEIMIYPPGHKRSESAPLLGTNTGDLDLPHTPWLSSHMPNDSPTDEVEDPLRRGGIFPFDSPKNHNGPTAPLRVKRNKELMRREMRARSMVLQSGHNSDIRRRQRRGRDTQLETVSLLAGAVSVMGPSAKWCT